MIEILMYDDMLVACRYTLQKQVTANLKNAHM
jgi:hypothetical protein